MLKMALRSPGKGPTGIIGITDENIKRMRAGMPLDINLKEITPPGDPRMKRLVIHLADTYEHVVDDMEKDGLPVTEELRKQARDLDAELAKEEPDPNVG
jgi:hypothetical protein